MLAYQFVAGLPNGDGFDVSTDDAQSHFC